MKFRIFRVIVCFGLVLPVSKNQAADSPIPSVFRHETGGILPLFQSYLELPEHVGTKKYYEATAAFRSANFFQNAVIPYEEYAKLMVDFKNTYEEQVAAIKENGGSVSPYIAKASVPQGGRIVFMGDLHGNIQAFVRQLTRLIADGFLDINLKIINPNDRVIFLGDFVDYGAYGADTLAVVMYMRVQNPTQVLICRGIMKMRGKIGLMDFNMK